MNRTAPAPLAPTIATAQQGTPVICPDCDSILYVMGRGAVVCEQCKTRLYVDSDATVKILPAPPSHLNLSKYRDSLKSSTTLIDTPVESLSAIHNGLRCGFCSLIVEVTTSFLVRWFTGFQSREHDKTLKVEGLAGIGIEDGTVLTYQGKYRVPLFQTGRVCSGCLSKVNLNRIDPDSGKNISDSILPESNQSGLAQRDSPDVEPMYLKEGTVEGLTEREWILKGSPLAMYEALVARFKAEGRDWTKIVCPKLPYTFTVTPLAGGGRFIQASTVLPKKQVEARKRRSKMSTSRVRIG